LLKNHFREGKGCARDLTELFSPRPTHSPGVGLKCFSYTYVALEILAEIAWENCPKEVLICQEAAESREKEIRR
jgi:hypothetical protein